MVRENGSGAHIHGHRFRPARGRAGHGHFCDEIMENVIRPALPASMLDEDTLFYINPPAASS